MICSQEMAFFMLYHSDFPNKTQTAREPSTEAALPYLTDLKSFPGLRSSSASGKQSSN